MSTSYALFRYGFVILELMDGIYGSAATVSCAYVGQGYLAFRWGYRGQEIVGNILRGCLWLRVAYCLVDIHQFFSVVMLRLHLLA